MNQRLLPLAALSLLLGSVSAKPRMPQPMGHERRPAGQYAHWLTTTLDLKPAQEQAVCRFVGVQHLALHNTWRQTEFERGMGRMLTPGQYNAYAWLTESLPR